MVLDIESDEVSHPTVSNSNFVFQNIERIPDLNQNILKTVESGSGIISESRQQNRVKVADKVFIKVNKYVHPAQ